MLFSYKLKQVALGVVLSSCVLASGDGVSALGGGEVAEKAISLRAAPSVPREELSAPSPSASIFSSDAHKDIFRIIASYFDWKSLFQLRGVHRDFRSQLAVLGRNATPEAIEKAKQAAFVAVICEEGRSPADIPESLKQTFSWSNLVMLEGGIKPTDFEKLSAGLRALSLKSRTIWSDQAMAALQTWLDRTTHLESLNLPYCLVGPTIAGISQAATEAATFVSHLPLTLRHLNLSGDSHMGGHEIVNSLLRALSQSPVPIASLNLKGRTVIDPGALPLSLASLTMNVPFYMSAETIKPLQLPQVLKKLRLVSNTSNKLENIINYIPASNIEALSISISAAHADDFIEFFDILEKSPSFSQVKSLGLEFNLLKDESVEKALQKLAGTQLVSLDLRQCFNLSEGYKDELRASLFCNRMNEKIEIKLSSPGLGRLIFL
ncbi:MAG: hypothetical protein ACRCTK_00425 [Alphaproteobacteria bacterium]